MFQRILNWIREVISKMISIPTLKQGLQIDVAITPVMVEALQTWSAIYTNQSPWLAVVLPRLLQDKIAVAKKAVLDAIVRSDPKRLEYVAFPALENNPTVRIRNNASRGNAALIA